MHILIFKQQIKFNNIITDTFTFLNGLIMNLGLKNLGFLKYKMLTVENQRYPVGRKSLKSLREQNIAGVSNRQNMLSCFFQFTHLLFGSDESDLMQMFAVLHKLMLSFILSSLDLLQARTESGPAGEGLTKQD